VAARVGTNGKKTALTRETFIAAKQVAAALPELAHYLLDKGLKFVLLGLINSDPLEKRFGWFRQLLGANYFARVRQFLEAEKKICIKCLVKPGHVTLQEVKEVFSECNGMEKEKIESDTAVLLASLPIESLSDNFEFEKGEEGIVFFVSGYISRSLLKSVKCDGCVALLRKNEDVPSIYFEDSFDSSIESINHGGLVTPSDLVNVTCVHALQLKTMIFDKGDVQRVFMEFGNPRNVFVQCYMKLLEREYATQSIISQTCPDGHKLKILFQKLPSECSTSSPRTLCPN
jgi:hypothetical protein